MELRIVEDSFFAFDPDRDIDAVLSRIHSPKIPLGPIDIQDSRAAICVIHRSPACCGLETMNGEAIRAD